MSVNLAASSAEQRLFERLSNFAETHQIPLLTFWTCSRYCLTLEEFLAILEDSGFIISPEEIEDLEDDGVEFVNLEALLNCVTYWKQQEGSVGAFASKQARSRAESAARTQKASRVSATNSRMKAVERQWKKDVKLNETLIRTKN